MTGVAAAHGYVWSYPIQIHAVALRADRITCCNFASAAVTNAGLLRNMQRHCFRLSQVETVLLLQMVHCNHDLVTLSKKGDLAPRRGV